MKKRFAVMVFLSMLVLSLSACEEPEPKTRIPDSVLTFELNGGTLESDHSLEAQPGEPIDMPTPSKEDHAFEGWYKGDSLDEPFDSEAMPEEDMTLHAKWTPYPRLGIDTHDGGDLIEVKQEPGTVVTLPTPSKEGYVFSGWYKDELYLTKFESNVMPEEDTVIHARWKAIPLYDETTELDYLIHSHTVEEDYTYETVEVTGYRGNEERLTVPETINGIQVTTVTFDYEENENVLYLELPKSALEINRMRDFVNLESLEFYGDVYFAGLSATTISSEDTTCSLSHIEESDLPLEIQEADCPVVAVTGLDVVEIPDDQVYRIYHVIVKKNAFYSEEQPPINYLDLSKYTFESFNQMETFEFPAHFELGYNPGFQVIQALKLSELLKSVTLADDVVRHEVIDGVLYEKTDDGLKLVFYPMGKTNTSYHIPEGVTEISGEVFMEWSFESLENIFYNNPHLETFTISDGHETFKMEDGILYSKDGSELILAPPQKDFEEIVIDDSVDCIHDFAFFSNDFVKRIILNHPEEDGVLPYPEGLFNRHRDDVTLYVPDNLLDTYKTHILWNAYEEYMKPLSTLE